MEKIVLHKNETAREALVRIEAAEDKELVLVIPRNSGLKDSVSNFHLLKREVTAMEKRLVIESVDEDVLALAKASRIEGIHPLFEGTRRTGPSLSDIVPLVRAAKEMIPKRAKKDTVTLEVTESDESSAVPILHRGNIPGWFRVIGIIGGAVAVFFVAVFTINLFFAKAQIAIRFKKTPVQFNGPVVMSAAVSSVSAEPPTLPAQLFTQTKNVTQLFPASGRAQVSEKATANLTIYNAYSSAPQSLVASTRFVTPGGLVFRLAQAVIVPGAHIENGKIVPSSIIASVVADTAGPSYNIGPVQKLVVSGFKGTPKYDGFYGALTTGVTGGFTGEKAVPTAKDLADAKTKVQALLMAAFTETFLKSVPKEFIIPDGSSDKQITKLTVNSSTDEKGNFSVFGEAQYRAMGFREEDVRSLLLQKSLSHSAGHVFESLALSYAKPQPQFDKKQLTVTVIASGTITTEFDGGVFAKSILGKSESEVRTTIAGLADLSDATVSLWPFWVRMVPADPGRIHISLE